MSDVRELLMDVAEVLYAERGLEGVPTREIARKAGQRNSSVVQYHFGSRHGLVLAVFQRRMAEINAARLVRLEALEAQGEGHDVRAWLEAYVMPFVEFVSGASPTTHYARFSLQATASLSFVREMSGEMHEFSSSQGQVRRHLVRVLSHLPAELARARVRLALAMTITELADFEYSRERDAAAAAAALPARIANLIDMMEGALIAPSTVV